MVSYLTILWLIYYITSLQSFPVFCGYLLIIALSGLWQKYTSRLNLRPFLILHNFGCCLVSLITLCGFLYGVYLSGSIYSKTPSSFLKLCFWLYWTTKNVELLDTVFMILRHRSRQISFLHVYHHSSMLLLSNIAYNSYYWPAIASILALNSFVHVVLYLYYGLSALRPQNPPQWKKQVTQIQILQFVFGFVLAFYGYANGHYCIYSIFYNSTMMVLFSNFYYHAYVKKPKLKLK
ncbi:elongation of very long chain fatty acids protein 1 [Patella vulgata]|uniref:elongation of very long chain fatty acids protein 1 n=1 Tax=Patella vulgata TaxID=6465 RepID=UPI00218063F5|nr:elongation of very long chain fatty acids protein 1 [Patella vulgata]XP_050393078.1 elongation of very long chain fatty acids protein 1 [Patella vulgata]XP_050393079.1 elongation of very long chain fatty acids protein 1 [Patella vulgata]XP_050393080.1 elongation of very long chain fatty acids protein 1 [Patella vulgata]